MTCMDGSGLLEPAGRGPLGEAADDEESESRLSGIDANADADASRSSGKRSSSSAPFSSSISASVDSNTDSCACCCSSWACACAVGGAGKPVNSNASSSVAKKWKRRGQMEVSFFFGGGARVHLGARYAPSSKKYTRVLSPRM